MDYPFDAVDVYRILQFPHVRGDRDPDRRFITSDGRTAARALLERACGLTYNDVPYNVVGHPAKKKSPSVADYVRSGRMSGVVVSIDDDGMVLVSDNFGVSFHAEVIPPAQLWSEVGAEKRPDMPLITLKPGGNGRKRFTLFFIPKDSPYYGQVECIWTYTNKGKGCVPGLEPLIGLLKHHVSQ